MPLTRLASRPAAIVLALSAALLVAGCESREEKAERFYQSGLALLEAGDQERALIELRNVFEYDGFHKEARQLYADVNLERGDVTEAYSHYLRLIEQYPDTAAVRETLAELAFDRGEWEEAERHGNEAVRLNPESPDVQGIGVALRYRGAIEAGDDALREELAREARVLLAGHPEVQLARRVAIDWLLDGPNPQDALPEIELALDADPDSLELHVMKFRLLDEAADVEGTGAQLEEMYERFPDNQEVRSALVSWYLEQQDLDGAEAFLRDLAGDDAGPTEGHVSVVQFLQAARGPEAAATELDRLVAANEDGANADLYRALRAGLDFDAGRQAEAVAAFEDILATAEPTDQTRTIKGMLARILAATGNQVGARARVEEILAEDPTNAAALKMRAAWSILEDRPGEAIADLRAALSQEPRDIEALTLMAEAHERDGSLDLAAERLALAVEVSNRAPEPSIRYAEFLLREGRDQVAETVLADARAANPADLSIALRLADLWLQAGDFARVEEVVDELGSLGAPGAADAAQQLRAAMLLAQDRTDDGLAALQSIVDAGGSEGLGAIAGILETMVRDDRVEEARRYLDAEIQKAPESRELRLMSASLQTVAGETEPAEAAYRAMIEDDPAYEPAVRALYGLLASQERAEEATAALDAGLSASPGSATLRWIRAAELERAGDIDGAIAIYEELYAANSTDVIVANNLASLISAHRDDAESLDRAYAVARRLRGTDEPAFQDTYGWIAYRRGDLQEALDYLGPAAEQLPDDPLVQLHLGMTYAGLDRRDDAIRQIERALDLAGDSTLPQFAQARATLAELQGAPTGDGGQDDELADSTAEPPAAAEEATPATPESAEAAP